MTRKRAHHGNRRRGSRPRAHKPRTYLEGTLRVVSSRAAEVETAEGTFAVARRGMREAMNGDEVQVSLVPMHGSGNEPVAYVQGVLQRACTNFLGTYNVADPLGVVTPLDGRLGHDFFVLPSDDSAQRLGVHENDVVAARILEYPTRHAAGVVTIDRRVGSSAELDVGIEAIIASWGLATEFPDRVLDEVRDLRVDAEAALKQDALRRDLRDELCVTIDPADARDFDDAVAVSKIEGGYRLSVHIADVTHYVPWDSSTDIEARHRTCSVYLADRVLPMLPEVLCNDVCSLRPNEDRLAMTVRLELDEQGHVRGSEAFPSVIRSKSRLSYDEVDAYLQGDDAACPDLVDELGEMLSLLDTVAQMRLGIRAARGSIDFATTESKVVLDEDGKPIDVVLRMRTRATSMVEEAMLLANESVAKMLADREVPAAYRVHERPAPEDLVSCVAPLRELGILDGASANALIAGDPFVMQEVLAAARKAGTGAEVLANALLLRAQKRAIYLPHNDGHYALGAKAYCHFTSPIRRYPDVLVHRALKRLLLGQLETPEAYDIQKSLPQLCRSCSDQERVADSAARDSQHFKMAQYYGEHIGERFWGVVVGCERFGLFVMLDDTGAEGLLPVRALGEEWHAYDAERMCLIGESTGKIWRIGQHVAVTVEGTDPARGRIVFARA